MVERSRTRVSDHQRPQAAAHRTAADALEVAAVRLDTLVDRRRLGWLLEHLGHRMALVVVEDIVVEDTVVEDTVVVGEEDTAVADSVVVLVVVVAEDTVGFAVACMAVAADTAVAVGCADVVEVVEV